MPTAARRSDKRERAAHGTTSDQTSYNMIVIGIIGPPAGGKSTVARALAEQGAAWINADRLAHAALRMGRVKNKLREHFGDSIFNTAGAVQRPALAAKVFGDDPTSRRQLEYIESVLHPVVGQLAARKLQRLAAQQQSVVVIDAPLLIEANWHFQCDEIWYVDSPWEQRIQWIAKRSWTPEQLRQREARQLSLAEKRRYATRILDNSQGPPHTRRQILALWRQLTK
ncbi:dephospho-CoA kinase [Rosistilla oblonga]|uniref:Dephospho-CoA kinase n=2 Tax=Rosistilla oblonga TaxID=2527990 RepID=A0A518IWJ9_9BACT|nr:dephospho-CoA kinase [Rosistilla oblonga]QDV57435.1 Dephospho-CoA kinase [Rosistilla oblonga]